MATLAGSSVDLINYERSTIPEVPVQGQVKFFQVKRRWIFAIAILSILAFCLLVALLVILSDKSPAPVQTSCNVSANDNNQVCQEYYCEKTALELEGVMDRSINPCDDFYKYTCGKWPKESSSYSYYLTIEIFQKLAKILETMKPNNSPIEKKHPHDIVAYMYKSCIDQYEDDRTSDLQKVIDSIGGWPLIGANTPDALQDIVEFSMKAVSAFHLQTLFNVAVIPNLLPSPSEGKDFILTISNGKFTALPMEPPSPLLYESENIESENKTEVHLDIKNIICIVYPNCADFPNLDADIEDLMELNSHLQSNSTSNVLDSLKFSLGVLNRKLSLDWVKIVKDLITEARTPSNVLNSAKVEVDESYEVLFAVSAINETLTILRDTKLRTVQNWFVWKIVSVLGPEFYQTMRKAKKSRLTDSVICAYDVGMLMPLAVVDLYDENSWRDRSVNKKVKVLKVIEELKATIVQSLKANDWLDEYDKTRLVEKVENIVPHVAYPDWIKDGNRLADYYNLNIKPSETVTYFDVWLRLSGLKWGHEVIKLSEKLVREEYWHYPSLLVVNAWYNRLDNSITIPIGFLDYPFFADVFQPRSYMFGLFGAVVGHEIFHSLDPQSIIFDKNGKLGNASYSKSFTNSYGERVQCLTNQYKAEGLNAKNTIAEDFADNAAFQMIQQTVESSQLFIDYNLPFKKLKITKEQLLFHSFAWFFCEGESKHDKNDVHTSGKYRALLVLRNTPQFSKAFNCTLGSKMNPEQKCKIF